MINTIVADKGNWSGEKGWIKFDAENDSFTLQDVDGMFFLEETETDSFMLKDESGKDVDVWVTEMPTSGKFVAIDLKSGVSRASGGPVVALAQVLWNR